VSWQTAAVGGLPAADTRAGTMCTCSTYMVPSAAHAGPVLSHLEYGQRRLAVGATCGSDAYRPSLGGTAGLMSSPRRVHAAAFRPAVLSLPPADAPSHATRRFSETAASGLC